MPPRERRPDDLKQDAEPRVGGLAPAREPGGERLGVHAVAGQRVGELGQGRTGRRGDVRPQGRLPELDRPQPRQLPGAGDDGVAEEVAVPAGVVLAEVDAAGEHAQLAQRAVRQGDGQLGDLRGGRGERGVRRGLVGEVRGDLAREARRKPRRLGDELEPGAPGRPGLRRGVVQLPRHHPSPPPTIKRTEPPRPRTPHPDPAEPETAGGGHLRAPVSMPNLYRSHSRGSSTR